jgi:hypothetical protein
MTKIKIKIYDTHKLDLAVKKERPHKQRDGGNWARQLQSVT